MVKNLMNSTDERFWGKLKKMNKTIEQFARFFVAVKSQPMHDFVNFPCI